MGTPDERFSDEKALEEEHSALRSLMTWIEADLASELKVDEVVRADGPLLAPLKSFREHLVRHFEFEERCGVIEAAFLVLPDASAAIEDWRRDHGKLTRELDGILERLEAAAARGAELGVDFVSDLRGFFADLRRHDAHENSVLGDERTAEFRTSQRRFERE